MIRIIHFLILVLIPFSGISPQSDKKIIYLNWENVVDISLKDNLTLKSKILDYDAQGLEERKAITSFLPVFSYQGIAILITRFSILLIYPCHCLPEEGVGSI